MSYYDVDAILTDAQKVPCTFELEIPGLGYIDENAGGDVRMLSHDPTLLGYILVLSDASAKLDQKGHARPAPSLAGRAPRRATPRSLHSREPRPPGRDCPPRAERTQGRCTHGGFEGPGREFLRTGCPDTGFI